jgi:hypothetical protein
MQCPGKKLEVVTGIPGRLACGTSQGLEFFQMEHDGSTFSSHPVLLQVCQLSAVM